MSTSDDNAVIEEVELFLQLGPIRAKIKRVKQHGPVTAILTIGGSILMPAQISIDDTTRKAKVFWIDDRGDTDAPRPASAVVAFGVDNPAVATVTADPSDPDAAEIVPVAEGSANVTVVFSDANGGPLLEPDGATPFSVDPAPFQVIAGQAATAGLEIESSATP